MKSKRVTLIIILVTVIMMTMVLVGSIIAAGKKIVVCNYGKGEIASFNSNDPYVISGDWEVYKDTLLISEHKDPSTIESVYLSSLKKSIKQSEETLYYSYRVIITGIPKDSVLCTHSNTFLQGYAVYFNGKLVAADNHLVTKDGTTVTLEDYSKSYYYGDNDELEIVVELANESSSYYGIVGDFYLDGVAKHYSLFSFQAAYLIEIIICIMLVLYFLLLCFSRRNILRNILFVAINITTVGSILFNGQTTFFAFAPIPGLLEKMLRLLCLYSSTIIFCVLARTNICKRKFRLSEYLLIGSIVLAGLLLVFVPIQFSEHLFIVIYALSIIALLYSLISYLKESQKDPTIQVSIAFFLVEAMVCYVYEALLLSPIMPYNASSLSTLFFLACVLLTVLNSYLREKESEQANITKELNDKIRDTEFTFLNSQIQSHFIYNTLNSIQSLCNTNPERASELVEEFSFYLRNRLEFNKMPNLIPLEDEIDHIKTYVSIEQTRFGDNIKCVYDLAVTDIKIPPLSVQPLVENAVKHGVSKQVGGGTIILSSYQDKKNVYIRVKDNGLGFDVEKLKNTKRVGFNNIKDRLDLYLGATIKLDSKIGVGTVVTITIPKKNLEITKIAEAEPEQKKTKK